MPSSEYAHADERAPAVEARERSEADPYEGDLRALTSSGVQLLQRSIGNRATTRLIQRMSVVEAVTAAREAGFTDETKATELATAKQRYDPVAKEWVTPSDETLWDEFYARYVELKSTGKVKFCPDYKKWEKGRLEKAKKKLEKENEAKTPIDVDNEGELRALWGPSARFDKQERTKTIAEMFSREGYKTEVWESKMSSSETPPMMIKIAEHPGIQLIEIHPGGGKHGAPYIRLSTPTRVIKVINKGLKAEYDPLGQTRADEIFVDIPGE
jgi:hypothetical protein